jgi:fibronectin-binding autotransporter adhesin
MTGLKGGTMLKLSAATAAVLVAVAAGAVSARGAGGGSLCVGSTAGCFATIQAAVDASHDGDTIHVAAGTFAGGVTIDTSVKLIGAGAGETVISGGGPVLTIGVANAATEPVVTIDGVTVTGGVTLGNLAPERARGGGIYIPRAAGPSTGATVTIRNSVIRNNRVAPTGSVDSGIPCPGGGDCPFASSGGGGISNDGTLTLVQVQVVDNEADGAAGLGSDADGGGILNRAFGNLTLRSSVVSGNRAQVNAPNGRFADGGGINAVAGSLTIEGSMISVNTASVAAAFPSEVETSALSGGLHSQSGVSASIHDTTISGNTATETNTLGSATAFCGGICTDGSVGLRGDTVAGNHVVATTPTGDASADSGGLGVGCCDNPPTIVTVNSTSFTTNTVDATAATGAASASGGGVSMANTPAVVFRSDVISRNHIRATSATGSVTVHGGGVNNGGMLVLRDTAVSWNTAVADGPAGEAQGAGIWNGRFDPAGPPPALSLFGSNVTQNTLTAAAGVSANGGGIFTTAPVLGAGSVIAQNAPDDCFGC